MSLKTKLIIASSAFALSLSQAAHAQLDEIIVTATKKEESINSVPMAISAATGSQLQDLGVTEVQDLGKISPSFSFQQNAYGNTTLNLRGVGNLNDAIASAPTVSVYVDQAPLSYTIMAQGLTYDLERVEVLKGPQGTLFGQNATGGAINFIPKKPGDTVEAGIRASYGRFDAIQADAYYSTPLSDNLGLRLSGIIEQGGAWQQSVTRPDDELGKRDFISGRAIFDWDSDRFDLTLNLNAYSNNSESQAAQYLDEITEDVGGYTEVIRANRNAFEAANPGFNAENNRLADWHPDADLLAEADQYQIALNTQYELSDNITLNTITNYVDHDTRLDTDNTGTPFVSLSTVVAGQISTFSQEVRLSGGLSDQLDWMVGVNYQNDDVAWRADSALNLGTSLFPRWEVTDFYPFPGPPSGVTDISASGPYDGSLKDVQTQDIRTLGFFGGLDFEVSDAFTLRGSVRYTESKNDYSGCFAGGDDGRFVDAIAHFAPFNFPVAGEQNCITVLDPGTPGFSPLVIPGSGGLAAFVPATAGLFRTELNEDNVSFRVGADYTPTPGSLVYANVTRGYKAGDFPRVPGFSPQQFTPSPQEELTSYEVGFKHAVGNTAQLNGAAFYYDYTDKQAIGTTFVVGFGDLPAGVSVPSAKALGFEFDALWQPVESLTTRLGVAYMDTEFTTDQLVVDGVLQTPFDINDNPIALDGLAFPTTSKWNLTADVEYRTPFSDDKEFFIGVSPRYRSSFITGIQSDPRFEIDGHMVVDGRAGVEFDNVKFELWGRNLLDQDYGVSRAPVGGILRQLNGRPLTYGIAISYDY